MKQPNLRKPAVVLYDGADADGLFAAFAAFKALEDNAEYIPLDHGNFTEQVSSDMVRGRETYVLDIALSDDQVNWLKSQAATLRVIDHHVSSAAVYGKHHYCCTFDAEKCAAVLAWEHFHPTLALPDIYRYVQDRDLWQWRLEHSREVSAAIASHPWDFNHCEMMLNSIGQLAGEGFAILRRINIEAARVAKNAFVAPVAGHEVTVANCATFISEAHERLHEQRLVDEQPFTATFVVLVDGSYRWDLRSHGSFDVGELARAHGGGGHAAAAGFIAPADNPYATPPAKKNEPKDAKKDAKADK